MIFFLVNISKNGIFISFYFLVSSLGKEKLSLYSLRFSNWDLQIKLIKEQNNRRKGIQFLLTLIFFMCMEASQKRSENPKKQLDLGAYISF